MIDYYFAIIFFGVFIMIIMKLMLHNDEMLEEEIKALVFQLSQETMELELLGSYRCEGDFVQ